MIAEIWRGSDSAVMDGGSPRVTRVRVSPGNLLYVPINYTPIVRRDGTGEPHPRSAAV